MTTIADVLMRRAREQGGKLAYGFLRFPGGDEVRETSITYGELDRRSRAVAARLEELGASGRNVLLLLDTGPDFLASFFGCLYAGAVAVPAPGDGKSSRLGAIAKDAGVEIALGFVPDDARARLEKEIGRPIRWIRPDSPGAPERDATPAPGPLAFLQYTSGSTAEPKGVMVGHESLMHNLDYAATVEGNDGRSASVCWLPHYHDMGLVEGILQPLYSGYPAYLFAPEAFLEKPLRWLSAISRYRATTSGAPNFAYDLCVRKTTPEERRCLDLRSWRVAYNGAEPIRAETLRSFFEAFAGCGFRWRSFYPVYGLAESTLVVTSPSRDDDPVLAAFDESTGERRQGRVRVGCGRPQCGVRVEIVDRRRRTRVGDGEIGEIWVSSVSNALGYWNRPEASRETFHAFLRDTGEGPFLRTGDLGLRHRGELFVVGRIKDVVVVRGRNYHPGDVEWTAEKAHPAVRAGGVVLFSSESDDGAVLLAEVLEEDETISTRLRTAVLEEHRLGLDAVALVPPRSLLKTSSGKLRRSACRRAFFEGRLDVLRRDDGPWLDPGSRPADCLDSLGILSLAEELGVSVRDVLEASSVAELAARSPGEEASPEQDALLPVDVVPEDCGPPPLRLGAILLTGATGFLGAYLLRELLERTEARLFCLLREGGIDRVRRNLASHGLWEAEYEGRIAAVSGDAARPRLGLSGGEFERLAHTLDGVVHNAAAVNFVYPYRELRDTNVGGTLEALRLACLGRSKRFHFVSTLAVLYTAGRRVVTEATDALPFLSELHLGYAETKAVAESLVRQASERGLTASIYRLALLSGAEASGRANENDFLSRLLRGCVRAGTAPDLDVELDACPVDYASRAVAALMLEPAEERLTLFHVRNEEPRHFRELVLWMNLFGYSVALEPYRKWLASLDGRSDPRRPLRDFFSRRVDGLFLPERYEEGRKATVRSEDTRGKLAGLGITSRRSSPDYLERCFRSFIERGALPEPSRPARGPSLAAREWLSEALGREVRSVELSPSGLEQSILTEITSWYAGRGTGLYRASVRYRDGDGGAKRMFLKVKPSDREVMTVARKVAELSSPRLGAAFEQFEDHIGFSGTHRRELELYQTEDRRLQDHMPHRYGVLRDDSNERFVLALEELPVEAGRQRSWSRSRLEAAVRGLSAIHASGLLPSVAPRRPMAEMEELWAALFEHARPWFREWGGDDLTRAHEKALAELATWSKELESLPRTLIHNDFNPRNLFLRPSGRLCAFDWELATLGPPQRDLAELLSFVLTPGATSGELVLYLELHRRCLEEQTGRTIDGREFARGFELALRELIVDRFPMYTLVHRFQKKPFLARVVPTWLHLARLMDDVAADLNRSPRSSAPPAPSFCRTARGQRR